MQEYVHAHATYRFVLMDEERERPRILVSRICEQEDLNPSLNKAIDLVVQAHDASSIYDPIPVCYSEERIVPCRQGTIKSFGPFSKYCRYAIVSTP